jgi:hypothetical protein
MDPLQKLNVVPLYNADAARQEAKKAELDGKK